MEAPVAPSYQSIATADYTVSPHGDDFGPYTPGTLTGGMQEALLTAGNSGSVFVRTGVYVLHRPIFQKGNDQSLVFEAGVNLQAASDFVLPVAGINGMLSLGYDGTTDYDGFLFEGGGGLFDCQLVGGTVNPVAGIYVTGKNREAVRFGIRNFRVQNSYGYGVVIGRADLSNFTGSVVGLVTVDNFDIFNCAWILVWAAEHVRLRHGRCRQIPTNTSVDGWFVTSQHGSSGALTTRDIVFEDVTGDATGSGNYANTLEVQGNAGTGNPDLTRDITFRRCYLKGRNSGDWYLDDAVNTTGAGYVESLAFEDCTFDNMTSQSPAGRIVSNANEGLVVFDHCDFVNGASLPTTRFLGGTVATRPMIVRRPITAVTYPNQTFGITVGTSPFAFTNGHRYVVLVVIQAGNVTKIQITPRGGGPITTGETAGAFYLSTDDALTVTYTVKGNKGAPTMTGMPWDANPVYPE